MTHDRPLEEKGLKALYESISSSLLGKPPCLEEICPLLDRLDNLPLDQRLNFIKQALLERRFIAPAEELQAPFPLLGQRLLQSMACLWTETLPGEGPVFQGTCEPEDLTFKSGITPLKIAHGVLAMALSWGATREAAELWRKVFLPGLGLSTQPPWGMQAGVLSGLLQKFSAYGALETIQEDMAGTLDSTLPLWHTEPHASYLAFWLRQPDLIQRELFRTLFMPHQCTTLERVSSQDRDAIFSLFHHFNTTRPQTLQVFHETFPWLIDAVGVTLLTPLVAQRTNKPLSEVTPLKALQGDIHDACFSSLLMLATQKWQRWGAQQSSAFQEALLWAMADQGPLREVHCWVQWAQTHTLNEDWWEERQQRPGLFTFLALSSVRDMTTLKTDVTFGQRIQRMHAWAQALIEAYPKQKEPLKEELGRALEALMVTGEVRGSLSVKNQVAHTGTQNIAWGGILHPTQETALLELGCMVGERWWQHPFALTLEEACKHEQWASKIVWSIRKPPTKQASTVESFTARNVTFATSKGKQGKAVTRLDLLAPVLPLFYTYRDRLFLESSLKENEPCSPQNASSRRRRV